MEGHLYRCPNPLATESISTSSSAPQWRGIFIDARIFPVLEDMAAVFQPQWRGIFIDARITHGALNIRTVRLPQWRGIFIDARNWLNTRKGPPSTTCRNGGASL